jgi:hypothetical protein
MQNRQILPIAGGVVCLVHSRQMSCKEPPFNETPSWFFGKGKT